jgi:hypothetical protein
VERFSQIPSVLTFQGIYYQSMKMEHPPLRWPLGNDALQAIRQKLTAQLEELNKWEAMTRSTSFPE